MINQCSQVVNIIKWLACSYFVRYWYYVVSLLWWLLFLHVHHSSTSEYWRCCNLLPLVPSSEFEGYADPAELDRHNNQLQESCENKNEKRLYPYSYSFNMVIGILMVMWWWYYCGGDDGNCYFLVMCNMCYAIAISW